MEKIKLIQEKFLELKKVIDETSNDELPNGFACNASIVIPTKENKELEGVIIGSAASNKRALIELIMLCIK